MSERLKAFTKAAAKWWADLLREQVPPIHNVGTKDPDAALLGTRMTVYSAKYTEPIPPEKIDEFEARLADAIEQWMAEDNYVAFGTDYQPDKKFNEVIQACGLDLDFVLPAKTMMFINKGQVKVRKGYGSPIELVYSAGDYEEAK